MADKLIDELRGLYSMAEGLQKLYHKIQRGYCDKMSIEEKARYDAQFRIHQLREELLNAAIALKTGVSVLNQETFSDERFSGRYFEIFVEEIQKFCVANELKIISKAGDTKRFGYISIYWNL